MPNFLGSEVEEIFDEEFSFENLNSMNSSNGLILLMRDHYQKCSGIDTWLELLGDSHQHLLVSFV